VNLCALCVEDALTLMIFDLSIDGDQYLA